MASGFESSSFKRTFTVEKRNDGTTLISYKAFRRGWGIFLVFGVPIIGGLFLIPGILERFLPLPIDGLRTFLFDNFQILFSKSDVYDYLRVLPILILGIWAFKSTFKKGKLIIHDQGLEFLGKKLSFKDIGLTGVKTFGGGTAVYSVNGIVQSETQSETYGVYANAFGQDVMLTEHIKEEASAIGIVEVIRQAMKGQSIQAQQQTSNSDTSNVSSNKFVAWVLNNKVVKWILILIVVKYILGVLNIF